MSNIANLGNFPHTIGNLDNRPNLTGEQLKAKLEQDVMTLWSKLVEMVPELNNKLSPTDLVDIVNASSTDSNVPTAKAVYDAIVDATLGGNAQQIIEDWLDAHPEATTTVQDGSITNAKLASAFVTPGLAKEYVSNIFYPAGSFVFHSGVLYTNESDVSDAVWTAANWKVASMDDYVSTIVQDMGASSFNIADSDHGTMVSRFPAYVSFSGNKVTFSTNTSGSNYACLYFPIKPETSYEFVIDNSSALEKCGYLLTDSISASWNPGGQTEQAHGVVNNTTHKYLMLLLVGWSTFSGTASVTVKQHLHRSVIDSVVSTERSLSDIDNKAYAENCTIVARYSDYVAMSGHKVIFNENPSGSNIVNVYIPLEFGAHYSIDMTAFSGLQNYGVKTANTIGDVSNQGFVGSGWDTYSIRNDGPNNKYLVVLLQAISTFNGSVLVDVRKDAEKGYLARVGAGYKYSSILGALKGTPDYVELMLTDPVYNVYQEYLDYYGASFWDDYTGYAGQTDMFTAGLWMTGNRKIRGTGSNKVRFQYTGDNEAVKTDFSLFAFYPQYSTVEIADFTILFSGIRYAVHDDFAPTNAHVIMDGIVFDGNPHSGAVIGAGLGINSTYIIKNCIFLANEKPYDISYHGSTNALTTNRCKICVLNCYGSKTCAFRWYGASELVSDCIVNNSKFGSIVCQAYDSSQPNQNMRLIAYCNEIGS